GYCIWEEFAKMGGIQNKDAQTTGDKSAEASVERVIQTNPGGDTQERWIHCCMYPIRADHAEHRYIVALSDRTKSHNHSKKLAETLQEAIDDAQNQKALLNNMSHEMRTSLSSILALATNAKDDLAQPNYWEKVLPALNKIQISCAYLLSLTNEVLDSAKIRSDKFQLVREKFALDTLIADVTDLVSVQAAGKNQRFVVVIDNEPLTYLWGDVLHIKQILINLLSNAVKFTPVRGDIRLEVHCADAQDGRLGIRFLVKDNGIGMSSDFQKKIFLPFEQEGRDQGQALGTGLGMNICKILVDTMGGSIAVHSALDNGTTFTLELQFDTADPRDIPKIVPLGQLRTLVVGNDAVAMGAIVGALQQLGVMADAAPSHERARAYLHECRLAARPYHICLFSDSIAEGEALWMARNIRQELQDTQIKLLRVSAGRSGQAADGGTYFDGFVEPPVLRSRLYAAILKATRPEPVSHQDTVPAAQSLKSCRILLADDNEINRDIFRDWFIMAGAEVVCVQDGIQLFETFVGSAPGMYDAIVMDLRMPRMDGWRAAWTVRHSGHADSQCVPIIGTTGSTNEEERLRAVESGMNCCLTKPVSAVTLYSVLQQYISFEVKDGTQVCG
ncbi:MAG: ATP-binding protein, partial [Eubacteriales bacterium]|nr:ATP-binding protein [Eubacteriales bacterium]